MARGVSMPLLGAVVHVNTMMEEMAKLGIIPAAQIEGHCWMPAPSLTVEVSK